MGYLYGIPNTLHYVMRPILRRPKTIFESNYGKIKGILSPSEHPNYWFQWFPSDSEQGHYIDPEEVKLEEYATLRQGIESITAIMRKPMVFKCLYLDMSVGVLSQIFPNAKFLFVRRDQFFVCQSLLLGRLKQKDINEWWSVKPPHYRDLLSLPIWQQVTEQVFQTEKIISRDLSRFAGDRYLEVHYEKLCKEPQPVLEEISSWLAASGYKVYDDINFPQEFTVSQKINLSKTMADKIKSHLTVLKEQDKY